MSQSSILGGQKAPTQAPGRDTDALGPSDSSDSGSDVQGEHTRLASDPDDAGAVPADLESDTDSSGTGERGAAYGNDVDEGADIRPDHVDAISDVGEEAVEADDTDVEDIVDEDAEEESDESTAR